MKHQTMLLLSWLFPDPVAGVERPAGGVGQQWLSAGLLAGLLLLVTPGGYAANIAIASGALIGQGQ